MRKWEAGDYLPLEYFLFKESDSLREAPIGKNGFAYGETEILPMSWGGDSVFFFPDLNYSCEIPDSTRICMGGCWYSHRMRPYDVRAECPLRYDCLKSDFEPSYYPTAIPAVRESFSHWTVFTEKRGIRIVGGKGTPFAVFNSKGQAVFRGRASGNAAVPVPASGSYLVKMGSEARRVNVR